MVKKRRIWKDAEIYTSFPFSFGCDDDEEQRSSVGDNEPEILSLVLIIVGGNNCKH